MSRKNKTVGRKRNPHRIGVRESVLANKVAKEEHQFDLQYHIIKQQIMAKFPDPVDRLRYINGLISAMNEPMQEIPEESGQHPATSGYAEIAETARWLDEEQAIIDQEHNGDCSCGCHEEN